MLHLISKRSAEIRRTFTPYFIPVALNHISPPPTAGLREWRSVERKLPPAEEVVQPKRLLQQIHSQEELLHSRLDTRVNNRTAGVQVSLLC